MVDVKNVVQAAYPCLVGCTGGDAVAGGVGMDEQIGGEAYRAGLRRGGWLTSSWLGVMILFVLMAFGVSLWHSIRYSLPGTWTFLLQRYPDPHCSPSVSGGISLFMWEGLRCWEGWGWRWDFEAKRINNKASRRFTTCGSFICMLLRLALLRHGFGGFLDCLRVAQVIVN